MKTVFNRIPVTQSADRRSHVCYGRTFPHDGSPKGKEAARLAAEAYGQERQAAMVAQSGRPLTAREEIDGRLAKPTPIVGPQPCGVRKIADATVNPYTAVIRSLETQFAPKPADKAKVARRLELYRQLEADWNAVAAGKIVAADNSADPNVIRFRKHAADKLDQAQLDAKLTPEQVEHRYALKTFADDPTTTPGDYWTKARELFGDAPPAVAE